MLDLRLYAGYSGWGPGQLDEELAQDAWFVVDADPGDPFLPDGRRSGSGSSLARGSPGPDLAVSRRTPA